MNGISPDADGLPLWRWTGGQVCVASGDIDQLRFLGVALGGSTR